MLQKWCFYSKILGLVVMVWPAVNLQAQTVSSITRNYDPVTGRLQSITVNGVTTTYQYDVNGDIQSITNPRGFVTRYSNYFAGVAQLEERAYGTSELIAISRVVDDLGCIKSETDGEGLKTSYERDVYCRVTKVMPANATSSATSIAYFPPQANLPAKRISLRGGGLNNITVTEEFDGFGRLSRRSSAKVNLDFSYDARGNLIFQSYPYEDGSALPHHGVGYSYNESNQIVRKTFTADNSAVTYSYTLSGTGIPQLEVLDELGNKIIRKFRLFGGNAELMANESVAIPSANVSMERNVLGQLTKVTQNGLVRTYDRNPNLGFYISSITSPELGLVSFGRDPMGNMTNKKVAASKFSILYDYDAHGRMRTEKYADPSFDVVRSWYKNDRPKSAAASGSIRSWVYDPDGNLTLDRVEIDGHIFDTSFKYDTEDRLTTMAYPKNGTSFDLKPDSFGRPTQVGALAQSVSYWPSGNLKSMVYGNGLSSVFTLDSRIRPNSVQVSSATPNKVIDLGMIYDTSGNLQYYDDRVNMIESRSYKYDELGRLTHTIVGGVDYLTAYDGSGNIRQQNFGGRIDYSYDPVSNRLSGASGVLSAQMIYDIFGNIVSYGGKSYNYNFRSQLQCVDCYMSSEASYLYDGTGARLVRASSGKKIYQIFNLDNNLIFEFDPMGDARLEHVYLKGQRFSTVKREAYLKTTLSISSSAKITSTGSQVTLVASISGGNNPSGVVSFYDKGVLIGTGAINNGVASFTTTSLSYGVHDFSASYSSDGSNASSSSTTRASPLVKQKQARTNCAAIRLGISDVNLSIATTASQAKQGCGLQNYKRSLLRPSMPLTLMKDARGGSIR